MAKYTVLHACGHDQTHQLFGPHRDRDRKIQWLETTLCSDCWKQSQQESAKDATNELRLPQLEGSEKQVAWAERIRIELGRKFIESIIRATHHDPRVKGSLAGCEYPGVQLLAACDTLNEIYYESPEVVDGIRQVSEWFCSCRSSRQWIDCRDCSDLFEFIGITKQVH